jgi:predicted RNase H-like HicB family nuclease
VRVPVEVREKEDGPGYLAVCPAIRGCHAEGDSIGQAIDNLRDVARTLVEIMREDGTLPAVLRNGEGGHLEGVLMVGSVEVAGP